MDEHWDAFKPQTLYPTKVVDWTFLDGHISHTYTYTCIYIHIHTHIHVYIYIYTYTYIHIYRSTYTYIYIYIYNIFTLSIIITCWQVAQHIFSTSATTSPASTASILASWPSKMPRAIAEASDRNEHRFIGIPLG